MDDREFLQSFATRALRVDSALSVLYEDGKEVAWDFTAALGSCYAPETYSGEMTRRKVRVNCGVREVDQALGPLQGFVDVASSCFSNAVRVMAMYACEAQKQGLSTLFLTPSRGKSSFFHELTRPSRSISSLLTCSYSSLLHTLISVKRTETQCDFLIIDGLPSLFLSGKSIPSDGKDDYLLAVISEIKAIAAEKTVIVLLTLTAEGRLLGLGNWQENGQRSLTLRATGANSYSLEEVAERVVSVHFVLP